MSDSSWKASLPGALACVLFSVNTQAQVPMVLPTVETEPVPSGSDAADDAAIWVHPTEPALSTVIGTNKLGGLAVYDLSGTQLQYLPDGNLNNVDLRYLFPLGAQNVALVTSGERNNDLLTIYAVNPNTRLLENVAARPIPLGIAIYGSCMYRSPVSGATYFIGNSKGGEVEQWRLFDAGNRKVDAELVRSFVIGGQTEGCVADDENGWLFIGQENLGIWRYGAEPGDATAPVLVDSTGVGGQLTADVEGLTIYYAEDGGGYLIASSQGSSTFVVYERVPPHAPLSSFGIAGNPALGIDAVSETDGIDVMNLGLGDGFPGGVFIAQDDSNPGGNQNFKFVPWTSIAAAAVPPLVVDTEYDAGHANCPPVAWAYRFGSGTNPLLLVNVQPPRLGGTWEVDLDCAGHAPGVGSLLVFTRPGSGPNTFAGELLVDLSSTRVLRKSATHTGGVLRVDLAVPPDPALCALQATAQAVCFGAPGPVLSNAIDFALGW